MKTNVARYPEEFIASMRKEVRDAGFKELKTPEDVDNFIKNIKGTGLIFINSVCGCTAAAVRPGLVLSLQNSKKPQHLATSFAGADIEAVQRIREYLQPEPPSSPCIALFKDQQLIYFIPRQELEYKTKEEVAQFLKNLYDKFC